MKHLVYATALTLAAAIGGPVLAQQTITLADVAEFSGPGATVGTNWKNGIDLAVAEIHLTRRDVPKAIDNWERVVRLTPDNLAAHSRLARALENSQRPRDAASWLGS